MAIVGNLRRRKISSIQEISLIFHSPGRLELDTNTSITFANFTSAEDFSDGDFGFLLLDASETPISQLTGTNEDNYLDAPSISPRKVDGLAGNDMIWGSTGDDDLDGGDGDDWIYGKGGADHIDGGANNDVISGMGGGCVDFHIIWTKIS